MPSIQVSVLALLILGGISPCYSIFSRVVCVLPTYTSERSQNQETPTSSPNCSGSNLTLQHVLENYKDFFTSNTKLQLLPGVHEVSEPIGDVVARNIHNFVLTGASYTSVWGIRSCCKILCTGQNSSLGFAFLNSSNISLSRIQVTNCDTRTSKLQKEFQHLYSFAFGSLVTFLRDIELNDVFQSIYSACSGYTILAARSHHVTVDNMIFEHSTDGCFVAIGVNRLTLQHSLFRTRCMILALDSPGSTVDPPMWQNYSLTKLSFPATHGNSTGSKNNFGVYIQFHHNYESVAVFLETLLLDYQNLKLVNTNKHCNIMLNTIKINNLTIIGNTQTCYGLVLDKRRMGPPCYKAEIANGKLLLENSHFTQSNIHMMKHFHCRYSRTLVRNYDLNMEMKGVVIENVPCTCEAALSIYCAELTVNSFTLRDSCCKGEALVKLYSVSVWFVGLGLHQFLRNKRTCIAATYGTIVFTEATLFSDNKAHKYWGSTVSIINSVLITDIRTSSTNTLQFKNNTGKKCGGIIARDKSNIQISSPLEFFNNTGHNGGALALYDHSTVEYSKKKRVVSLEFVHNSALHNGGAIFIADDGHETTYYEETGMLSIHYTFLTIGTGRSRFVMTFVNNTALFSGSALYGGWIDMCDNEIRKNIITEITANDRDPSVVSSKPARVCICIDSTPQCNITDYATNPLYPGQSFQLEAVAVGQRFGTSPSIVLANFANTSIDVDELQQLQSVDKFCTSLNYTIKSPNERENLVITVNKEHIPEKPAPGSFISQRVIQEMTLLLKDLNVTIPLLQCPLGYGFDHNSSTCICKESVLNSGVICDTNTYSILRTKQQWINATFDHLDITETHGVLVHNNCPLDYCISKGQSLNLENPSDQCNFNRSGILCGSCKGNLSQILGSNRCKECSSLWAALVVPVFLLLGLGLVVLIIALDLTVAQGTVNALIFYANILSANQATFFPPETTDTFFRWYIAWLNLDVGIQTCFISGLDAYTKTWLQFLFPIYIWVLVILIIVASRYSTLAARLSGDNAVPALGTLFLLSYNKLLRITITTFSSTHLEYPNGFVKRVWVYDGNIQFLETKHVILFVAALLLLLLLSIPYTLVLFTIQWLQRLPYHCLLSWVWKLKPLFDAHTGPYKEKHRYWAGLLLMVRVVLFLVFSAGNVRNDPTLNLLVASITIFSLFTYLAHMGGVHRATYLDILEYSFLLNLGILSSATFYTRQTEGSQDKVIKTSVSTALVISIIIVFAHAYLKVKSTHKGGQCLKNITAKFQGSHGPLMWVLNRLGITNRVVADNAQVHTTIVHPKNPKNTRSSIRLRETLLVQETTVS